MQASTSIRPDYPDNAARFADPFFARFQVEQGKRSLTLDGGVEKAYPFPTLYGDVRCAIGIFLCSYEAARALLPHDKLVPVRMTRKKTLVIFSCYEYRQVMRVWPYNEIAMSIPVLANPGLDVPVLPMVASGLFPRFGYHVFSMPVTSRENQLRGRTFWGLPKVTQAIDIDEREGDCVTTAREADGTPYFTLRVPMAGKPARFDVQGHLYSEKDGRILKSKTCFAGSFGVTKNMGALFKPQPAPAKPFLTLGDSPSAQKLRALDIEPSPFQLRYTQSMNAAFDLPLEGYDITR